ARIRPPPDSRPHPDADRGHRPRPLPARAAPRLSTLAPVLPGGAGGLHERRQVDALQRPDRLSRHHLLATLRHARPDRPFSRPPVAPAGAPLGHGSVYPQVALPSGGG